MVLIHTTIKELDEALADVIPDSRIAYYPEYLMEEEKADTVILSYKVQTSNIPLKDFLFALRCQNKRIILILDDENNPLLGYALALGIYDIIFNEVSPRHAANMIENPAKFSNVAHLFVGLKKKVTFAGIVDDTKDEGSMTEPERNKAENAVKEEKGQREFLETNKNNDNNKSAGEPKAVAEITDINIAKEQIKGLLKLLKAGSNNEEDINKMLILLEDAVADFAVSADLISNEKIKQENIKEGSVGN